jgi:hypothetical protein
LFYRVAHKFFGRTFTSNAVSTSIKSPSAPQTIEFETKVFFHSPITDENCVAVMEAEAIGMNTVE